MIDRRPFVQKILKDRKDNLRVVSGIGTSTWDVMSAGDNLGNFGFKTPSISKRYVETVKNVDGIMNFINYWEEKRNKLPFEIDGIVVKINETDIQKEIGNTSKSLPKNKNLLKIIYN